ncbi:MAG: Ig-like domain-containing protein [Candidatus Cloacimonetes bacterium]|nr:Ig-like domain-containing protein [Candidatus Cloacimonadota bacterium]
MKFHWIYLLLLLLFLGSCQTDNPTSGGYSLTINAIPDTLYAGSLPNSSQITAMLIKDNLPEVGKEIQFSASIGEIPASTITNNNGLAITIFEYNGSEPGTATIKASYEEYEAVTQITILNNLTNLMLFADCDTLFMGSETNECQISALFTDSNDQPVENAPVVFTTDTGAITAFETTNAQGIALATFSYNGSQTGIANISASCSGLQAAMVIHLVPHPDLLLTLSSDTDTIYLSTGINYCQMYAALTRNGTPVANAQVNFSSDIGDVSGSALTDEAGIAESNFWYNGSASAVATCQAEFASLLDEITINIVNTPFYGLEIWAEPNMIYLDSGNYDSDVFARLTDINGDALAGEIVSFEASSGFIGSGSFTDSEGVAQVYFNFSGDEPEIIQISASYQNHTATGYIYVLDPELVLTVSADPDTIYEGTSANYADINALLTTESGAPISDVQINFSTSVGSILGYSYTNSQGIANSTFWYNERPDITAVITATYQDLAANTSVTILQNQLQIVFLEAEPLIIYADNDPETYSTIRARVFDAAGSPMEDAIVTFQTSLGYMALPSAQTNAFGYATNMLHDNGVSGIATIYLECDNDHSQIDVQILDQ